MDMRASPSLSVPAKQLPNDCTRSTATGSCWLRCRARRRQARQKRRGRVIAAILPRLWRLSPRASEKANSARTARQNAGAEEALLAVFSAADLRRRAAQVGAAGFFRAFVAGSRSGG